MTELLEAAVEITALLEARPSKHQTARDRDIRRALIKIEKLSRDRFRAQRKSVLDSHALANLRTVLDRAGHREAEETADEKRRRLEGDIEFALRDHITLQPVTAMEISVYDGAITTAANSGASAAASMLGTTAQPAESFIASYLKDGGFTRLTGELDRTTVDRLAGAVADAYESGDDFEGVVKAVKSVFADATTSRAKMIAATELNDAFNQGIIHFGRQAGGTQKEWEINPGACVICIENAEVGVIPIEEDFPSGDDAAPAHPFCGCSILIHA